MTGTLTLYQQGYPWDEAKQAVTAAFDETDRTIDRHEMSKGVDGIHPFLTRLKSKGFSHALATNDERQDTETVLSSLDLQNVFDLVVCRRRGNPTQATPWDCSCDL